MKCKICKKVKELNHLGWCWDCWIKEGKCPTCFDGKGDGEHHFSQHTH